MTIRKRKEITQKDSKKTKKELGPCPLPEEVWNIILGFTQYKGLSFQENLKPIIRLSHTCRDLYYSDYITHYLVHGAFEFDTSFQRVPRHDRMTTLKLSKGTLKTKKDSYPSLLNLCVTSSHFQPWMLSSCPNLESLEVSGAKLLWHERDFHSLDKLEKLKIPYMECWSDIAIACLKSLKVLEVEKFESDLTCCHSELLQNLERVKICGIQGAHFTLLDTFQKKFCMFRNVIDLEMEGYYFEFAGIIKMKMTRLKKFKYTSLVDQGSLDIPPNGLPLTLEELHLCNVSLVLCKPKHGLDSNISKLILDGSTYENLVHFDWEVTEYLKMLQYISLTVIEVSGSPWFENVYGPTKYNCHIPNIDIDRCYMDEFMVHTHHQENFISVTK